MHGLGSTDCTQASLCGCTRPERANRLILHIAVYVLIMVRHVSVFKGRNQIGLE